VSDTRLRRIVRVQAALLLVLPLAILVPIWQLVTLAGQPTWTTAGDGVARLTQCGTLPVLELSGTPAERGAQAARLVGGIANDLLRLMGLLPTGLLKRGQADFDASVDAIADSDRAQLDAFAQGTGLDPRRLAATNAMIEAMCSAVAHPPYVARNMDFFPPGTLGAATLLVVEREPGRRTYASVSWPGMIGVISGMNDAGLSACILLNWKAAYPPPGEPLPFVARRLLQDCRDVASAAAAFATSDVGSRHYLLLADARSAAVVWRDREGFHRDDLHDGWLFCDNLPRADGSSTGHRAASLRDEAAALPGPPGTAWYRSVLTASYMPLDNAQAMVFDGATRRLELARATDGAAAALQPWLALDLGPLLDGAPAASLAIDPLPPAVPLRHYLKR
jgi:hypothetical protein